MKDKRSGENCPSLKNQDMSPDISQRSSQSSVRRMNVTYDRFPSPDEHAMLCSGNVLWLALLQAPNMSDRSTVPPRGEAEAAFENDSPTTARQRQAVIYHKSSF